MIWDANNQRKRLQKVQISLLTVNPTAALLFPDGLLVEFFSIGYNNAVNDEDAVKLLNAIEISTISQAKSLVVEGGTYGK
jgi:hypothetical protein